MKASFLRVLLIASLSAASLVAQSTTSTYDAAAFGQWTIQSQSPNLYTFSPVSLCQQLAIGSLTFSPFAVNAPVYIQDPTAANSEVLIPSGVVQSSAQCGVTLAPTRTHTSFVLRSGTGGLQEALNSLDAVSNTLPAPIVLSRSWYAQAASVPGTTPAAIIAAAKGTTKAFLVDVTTAPYTFYSWNGTAYAPVLYANH